MSTTCTLPNAQAVSRIFTDLLGKSVNAGPGSPFDPSSGPGVIGLYSSGDEVVAAFASDVTVAAGAGAALSMIPPGAAQDCVKSGALTDNVMENFQEVLNIASQLFESPGHPRIRFRSAQQTKDGLSDEATALLGGAAGRLDLKIEIPGYGSGSISLLIR
ncbi:MAG: hypothetical protein JW958_01380 [Candidatus Eisenbacteria bacterium]|nr:hypothetical protein [Candidatus Eisenbacteria bacterium]